MYCRGMRRGSLYALRIQILNQKSTIPGHNLATFYEYFLLTNLLIMDQTHLYFR